MCANVGRRVRSVPGATTCGDGFLVRIDRLATSSLPNGILGLFMGSSELVGRKCRDVGS